MGQSRIQCWFWALMSWEFFLVEMTFHQVMPVYRVPRDLTPHGLSFKAIVLDDLEYAMGAFDAYVDTSRDYSTWFAKSSVGPIIRDVPMNGGKVLEGVVRTQVATGIEWRARAKTAEAKAVEFEALFTARKVHTQEEIAWVLAREREI